MPSTAKTNRLETHRVFNRRTFGVNGETNNRSIANVQHSPDRFTYVRTVSMLSQPNFNTIREAMLTQLSRRRRKKFYWILKSLDCHKPRIKLSCTDEAMHGWNTKLKVATPNSQSSSGKRQEDRNE